MSSLNMYNFCISASDCPSECCDLSLKKRSSKMLDNDYGCILLNSNLKIESKKVSPVC